MKKIYNKINNKINKKKIQLNIVIIIYKMN